MAEKTVPAVSEKQAPTAREETRGRARHLRPPVDIYETGEGLTVVADLPGVEKDAVELRVDNGVLSIEGQTRTAGPGEPVRSEFQLLSFFREFILPEEVDPEKIDADLRHGVLTVHLPKAERAMPKRIEVSVE